MEAATLPKKKTAISKGKVKKCLRNILSAPDPVFWIEISEEHAKLLESELEKYKVENLYKEYKKPNNWKKLKSIPKEQRPKPPTIPRVEGLIFGLTEVNKAMKSNECSAIIVDASVNPRALVVPLIEECISKRVPTVCLKELKKITTSYFGIATTCLGIKCLHLEDLKATISKIMSQYYSLPEQTETVDSTVPTYDLEVNINDMLQKVEKTVEPTPTPCHIYRSNRRTRIFIPSSMEPESKKASIEEDFIRLKEQETGPTYMTMLLKKIRNNQKRKLNRTKTTNNTV